MADLGLQLHDGGTSKPLLRQPFLSPSPSLLEPTAVSLRNLWFYLDTFGHAQWLGIAAISNAVPPDWNKAWIRTAQAASVARPHDFHLIGLAAIEVAHKVPADIHADCGFAKRRASLEIPAAGAPGTVALNYLSAFGFTSLNAIPMLDRQASL